MVLLLCGCSSIDERFRRDPYYRLYTHKLLEKEDFQFDSVSDKKYDFSASGMKLSEFSRWLSDVSGYGVVYTFGMENKTVTAEIKNARVDEILDSVSRMHDLQYVRFGNTFFIGKTRKEDRGIYVKRVKFLNIKELKTLLDTMLSENGKSGVSSEGVFVVSDVQSVLMRVAETVSRLESSAPDTWIVQFFVLSQKKEFNLNLGGKVNTSGKIAYELARGGDTKGFDFSDAESLAQNIDLVLKTKSEFVKVVSSPVLLLRDGTSASWSDGLTVPIPQKTVSESGTVTTTGYTNIDTGLQLSCALRESRSGAILSVKYTDSDIKGYNDYQPIISKSQLDVNADVQPGKTYLLGELFRNTYNRAVDQIADFSNVDNGTRIQLWCRAYRINICMEPISTGMEKKVVRKK